MHKDLPNRASNGQTGKIATEELGYGREAIAFLGIGRLKGVGFHTLARLGGRPGIRQLLDLKDMGLVARHLSPQTSAAAAQARGDWDAFRREVWSLGQEIVQRLAEQRISFFFADDPQFPQAFSAMPETDRPKWIFIRGDIRLLSRPLIAVVGTREPTDAGEFLARYAVSCARQLDTPVVSGLAQGIDRVVHEWCLRLSLPTISVLGTGILTSYPAKHATLGDAIVYAGGALVSEYLPESGPSAEQFVWRNRLQAALARALIPAEWNRKSGTAHTVRFARKFKCPVFGLDLVGTEHNSLAGDCDKSFRIPGDEVRFLEALRSALAVSRADLQPHQTDLFGENR